MIEVGNSVPEFELQNDAGETVSLADFKGKPWVLFFYPKDMTPGCTTEACDFRDNLKAFEKLGVAVIGVSRDSVQRHVRFKEKYQLNFPLLSDHEETLCNTFGVLVEKSMFGKKYMGIERSTYLIDEKGEVVALWRKVKIKDHVASVLAEAKRLFQKA